MGLKACVELEKGVLTIKVWRIRTDVQKGDVHGMERRRGRCEVHRCGDCFRHGCRATTQAVKDRDAVRVDG